MQHELAHSFYSLDEKYKQTVNKIVKETNPEEMKKLNAYLRLNGVPSDILNDERQAYLVSDKDDLKDAGIDFRKVEPVYDKLNEVYAETLTRRR